MQKVNEKLSLQDWLRPSFTVYLQLLRMEFGYLTTSLIWATLQGQFEW
jgi:hypothetical protein